jgi:hypothetical protein
VQCTKPPRATYHNVQVAIFLVVTPKDKNTVPGNIRIREVLGAKL